MNSSTHIFQNASKWLWTPQNLLKLKSQKQIFDTCYGKQFYIKNNLCWSWPRKETKVLETAAVTSSIDYNWKNMEISKFIFSLTKRVSPNFVSTTVLSKFAHLKNADFLMISGGTEIN